MRAAATLFPRESVGKPMLPVACNDRAGWAHAFRMVRAETEHRAALLSAEDQICTDVNEGSLAALVSMAAARFGPANDKWCCVGCDPDGLELQCGRKAMRIAFAERVTSPEQMRGVLAAMMRTNG